jgi:proteasome assembly chaperone (PAC2) family protein
MLNSNIEIVKELRSEDAALVMGFSGWMDGNDVSTGSVGYLVKTFNAELVARIQPEGYYIYQLPSSIEITNQFRPVVDIRKGVIRSLKEPTNLLYFDRQNRLFYFLGKEPHMNWQDYSACMFQLIELMGISRVFFVGSVAGLVPHTRQPRFTCLVSHEEMKLGLDEQNFKFADYQGPSSIVSYLTLLARQKNISMLSLITEIPAYIQGKNPKCLEAVLRLLTHLLKIEVDLDELRKTGERLEKKLNVAVKKREELAEHIKLLEEHYDKEVFDTEMGDLKLWLEDQGIRLD